jgi:hypothetical protein
MSAIGSSTRPRAFDRGRALAGAVALLATLTFGVAIGRVTAPAARPAHAGPAPIRLVPDDSAQVRLQVHRHMNELLAGKRTG